MASTFHYNLQHAQVMSLVGTGNSWLDIPGVTTLTPSASSSPTFFSADGEKKYVAYPAAEWSLSYGFAEGDFALLAVINGGEVSTSGTPGTDEIQRYEQPAAAANPPFALSGYAPNINDAVKMAGFRVTFPQVKSAPAFPAMGQETWGEWTGEGALSPDTNGIAVIYETLEAEPTFTNGVYAPNLEAPVTP